MMSLLLDEVALAALRLADAGVESPRADAELIAASVHNVRRGEVHTGRACGFDAGVWGEIARRAAAKRRRGPGVGPGRRPAPPASRSSTSPAALPSATSSSRSARACSCRA